MEAAIQQHVQQEIKASIMIAGKTKKYADVEKETSTN